jgi:pimeloyl-ACP methyl ester carboxylesterase
MTTIIRLSAAMLLAAATACVAKAPEERKIQVRAARSGSLCLYVSGSRKAQAPTVIFEAGLGDSSESWRNVSSSIATITQVIRYDRAGLGCSPLSAAPRTATQIASELRAALQSAKIAPPYLLVSHSAGAWYVMAFAAEHPNEVAGLLLVDPTPPKFFSEISSLQDEQERRDFASAISKYEAAALPGRRAEWASRDQAAVQAETAVMKAQMPLVIITAVGPQAGHNAAIRKYWHRQHERMAGATVRGRVVIANAGHYVQLEEPQIVVREIRRLLATVAGA